MRATSISGCLLLLSVTVALARQPETVDELKRRAEAARGNEQVKLYLVLAQRQLQSADEAYNQGKADAGHGAAEDAAASCEKAVTVAVDSHKHLKEAEIKIRELTRKLESLRRSLSFEEREPLQGVIDRMDKARNRLVNAMFGPKP